MDKKSALQLAIDRAGNQAKLARLLGIKPPSISGWLKRGRAPLGRCVQIEAKTGVRRDVLRPDHFGKTTKEKAA